MSAVVASGSIPTLTSAFQPAWQTAANSQWRVVDQVLTNSKAGANLVTRRTFTDFKLHLEFRYPKAGNSGV